MKPLRFAIVGLGVGRQHALYLSSLPGCIVDTLYDIDVQRANEVAHVIGDVHVASSYESILENKQIDAVVIASYDDDHFWQTRAALQANKHVFVEKPLCRTLDELRILKQLTQQTQRHVLSNLILRTAPLYRWLQAQIANNVLGQLYSMDGEYLFGRLHKITQGWRKDVPDYSVILGGGIHMVDLILWLSGQRPTHVYATGNRISTEGSAFRYNDFVSAVLRFSSGLIARINANFGCVHPHQHILRVFGTQATLLYDDAGPRWHQSRDPALSAAKISLSPLAGHKGDLLPEFVAGLQGKISLHTPQQMFDTISVCLACDQAQITQTETKVDYV